MENREPGIENGELVNWLSTIRHQRSAIDASRAHRLVWRRPGSLGLHHASQPVGLGSLQRPILP